MTILLVYFSATGNTARIAKVIAESLTAAGATVESIDITALAAHRQPIDLTAFEAMVLGMPIHSWRAPRVVREWLGTLNGQGKRCAMFFSYGGFQVHPAHYSTQQILTAQNFVVVSSAEFLGAHTFNIGGWHAMPGRPNQADLDLAAEYAKLAYQRLTGDDPEILGAMEQTEHTAEHLDAIESLRFKVLTALPNRGGAACSMCSQCEEACPTGAMDAEAGEADPAKCIACLGCVANCPEDALRINDMAASWAFKLQMEQATEESLKDKHSRVYF